MEIIATVEEDYNREDYNFIDQLANSLADIITQSMNKSTV